MESRESKEDGAAPKSAVLAVAHGGLSEGIRGLLSTQFDSVVMVADESSLMACLGSLHPDLLILGLALSAGDGIGLAHRLRVAHPGLRILLLVTDEDPAIEIAAARSGVDGCLLKQALGSDLLPAVEEVLAGGKAFWSTGDRESGRRPGQALLDANRKNGAK